jgi:hypothetical protein
MWDIALHDLSRPFRAQYRPSWNPHCSAGFRLSRPAQGTNRVPFGVLENHWAIRRSSAIPPPLCHLSATPTSPTGGPRRIKERWYLGR